MAKGKITPVREFKNQDLTSAFFTTTKLFTYLFPSHFISHAEINSTNSTTSRKFTQKGKERGLGQEKRFDFETLQE
jgi:hypothetical protein